MTFPVAEYLRPEKKFVETGRKASHSLKLLFPDCSFSCWDKCTHFWAVLMFLKPHLDLNLEHSSPKFTKTLTDSECFNLVCHSFSCHSVQSLPQTSLSCFPLASLRNMICHQWELMGSVYGSLMEVQFSPTLLLRAKLKRLSGPVHVHICTYLGCRPKGVETKHKLWPLVGRYLVSRSKAEVFCG